MAFGIPECNGDPHDKCPDGIGAVAIFAGILVVFNEVSGRAHQRDLAALGAADSGLNV